MAQRHHGQFDADPLAQQPRTSQCGVLSMLFGLIAWSVVVPTLLLVAVGLFIDECTVGHFSWTMLMVIVGVVVGSVNVLLWLHGRHPHVARGIHH